MPRINPTDAHGFWKRSASRLLDLLYPPACALCARPLSHGHALCANCANSLPRLAEPFCQSCGEMFPGQINDPFDCPNCHHLTFSFAFARPALTRDDRTLDLIHRLKYQREIHLARELGQLACAAFDDPRLDDALTHHWPLIPIPLHRRRLQHRHFNQAEELCRVIAHHTGLPVLKALRRTRKTDTQTRLSRQQRMANLRGAFSLTHHGRTWITHHPAPCAILVDDVLTTGSTVNECAKTLRHAGFKTLCVVTLMRG